MKTKMIRSVLLAACMAAVLPGCSWLSVGEEEFNCTGMPGNPYCASAREVYEKTNDGSVLSPVKPGEMCEDCGKDDEERDGDDRDGNSSKASSRKQKTINQNRDEISENYVAPALQNRPVPIRTPAQVMRIWIAPYVDASGDLIAPGFVYTEIEPRKWVYPDSQNRANSRAFMPLRGAPGYKPSMDFSTFRAKKPLNSKSLGGQTPRRPGNP